MKSLFVLIALCFLTNTFAALDMKPGLWKVMVKVKTDGKETNIQEQMQKAMAQMPAEKKAKMMEMMAKMNTGTGISPNGDLQLCYSKAMLENEQSIIDQKDINGKDSGCKTTISEKTSKKIVAKFDCKNGAKGVSVWNITSSTSFTGNVKTDNKGKKSEINHTGEFVSSDCGTIKPRL